MSMWKYIINLSLIFLLVPDSFSQEQDSLIRRPLVNGVRVGYDLSALVDSYFPSSPKVSTSRYEITCDVGIRKFFLVVDYGNVRRERSDDSSFTYKNTGSYYRLGFDYNIMKNKDAKNLIFVGARYCKSNFDEEGSYLVGNSFWGDANGTFSRNGSGATWCEMTAGLKAYIFKNFYLGYTLRYKILFKVKQDQVFEAFDIPGYGIAEKNGIFGVNYYIFYRIPIK